jgi:phenylalanyl-tRNA synthetase beta chain
VKLVVDWLREFVDAPEDPAHLAHLLGQRGFEVAEVDEAAGVIDVEITANRPDCLSVAGLARELSTALDRPLRLPGGRDGTPAPAPRPSEAPVEVLVEAPDLCPRYAAMVAAVRVGPSPEWLSRRLLAAGVRPINNVVDVTNYVMLERGHPMHAFDLAKLAGRKIVVRRAKAGERLRTLDGVERALQPDLLVIADAERAQALAGVMGGADSEVGALTTRIAIESAWFQPIAVRRAGKRTDLKTEASARFERGADIEAPVAALGVAAALLARIGAGAAAGPIVDCYPAPRQPLRLSLRRPRISRILGIEVADADVVRILERLGFAAKPVQSSSGETGWLVTVPSFRVDVAREIDLIEEIGRHVGYDTLPATFPPLRGMAPAPDARIGRDARLRRLLNGAGFSEAVTFTFIERQAAARVGGEGEAVSIANPLSETFAVLRPSMLPGLLDAVAHNRRRERRDVRLFETGSRFTASGGERRALGLAWTGDAASEHWSGTGRPVDFFDVKGTVETLAAAFGVAPQFEATERDYLVPGRAAAMYTPAGSGEPHGARPRALLGIVGQLAPSVAEAHDIPGGEPVFVAEVDLDALAPAAADREWQVAPLPRYPSIVRDISIEIDEALPAERVRGTIRSAAPSTLASVREFDRYQGAGVPAGRVSLSLRLTFRDAHRTLTDAEAQAAVQAIVDALAREHGARQR